MSIIDPSSERPIDDRTIARGRAEKPDQTIVRTHILQKRINVSFFWTLVGLLYLASATLLFFRTDGFFYLVNLLPRVLPGFIASPDPTELFTVVFASGYLVSQSFICFGVAFRPRLQFLAAVLLITKLAVVAGCAYIFLNKQKTFAFVLGGGVEAIVAVLLILRFLKIPFRRKPA